MKMNLPPFLELYRALIATPSISATDSALDQSNQALINLLSGWFSDLGFHVEVQPVPGTQHKFNMLARIGEGKGDYCWPGTRIPCRSTTDAGRAILHADRARQ